jgi:ferredoxin-NADP reductase
MNMDTAVASPAHLVTLQGCQQVAERTLALRFAKPAGFAFTPGQYVEIGLLHPAETDAEGNSRAFSIASAPHEDFLLVATRLRDTAFKRVLGGLTPGAEVGIDGPFGDLKLQNDKSRPAVILTGGIGITPFRSILLHAAKQNLPHHIFLFYANRRPEDAPFLDELQELERQYANCRLIACMTQMDKSQRAWSGETRAIDAPMLAKYLPGVVSPVYYLTGPPGMVHAMHELLRGTGVDDDNIRTEEFAGY